jgi:AcrR family transcriptional regulator
MGHPLEVFHTKLPLQHFSVGAGYDRFMTGDTPDANATLPVEGLRERKKRLMRGLISDTATQMFLARGFDDVKVIEIAQQCDVSEKTIYNYFPTKESLLLDREDAMATAIWQALGPTAPPLPPIEAALGVLAADLNSITAYLRGGNDDGLVTFRRFSELLDSTPSLRAAQCDVEERLAEVAAEAMADRAGISPDDPEPQIAAHAIVGLWRIQFAALRRYTGLNVDGADELREKVSADVRRAARLIDSGLWTFGVMVSGGNDEQMKTTALTAQHSARQVATALRRARANWRKLQIEQRQPATSAPVEHHELNVSSSRARLS